MKAERRRRDETRQPISSICKDRGIGTTALLVPFEFTSYLRSAKTITGYNGGVRVDAKTMSSSKGTEHAVKASRESSFSMANARSIAAARTALKRSKAVV